MLYLGPMKWRSNYGLRPSSLANHQSPINCVECRYLNARRVIGLYYVTTSTMSCTRLANRPCPTKRPDHNPLTINLSV